MGFWLEPNNFTSNGELIPREHYQARPVADYARYVLDYRETNGSPARTRIYFPKSGIVYQLNYTHRPSVIERRK